MFAQALRRTALRNRLFLTTALCGAALAPATAAAQDMGSFGTITSASTGTTANTDGTTLSIGARGNSIVNWSEFNVREGTTATFRNRDGASADTISILNRVTGSTHTDISGNLNSDANVDLYIINPNGVLFGANARVNVGGLVASTLNVTDADFLDGNGDLNFTGTVGATSGITVQSGAQFTVPGNLVFLGGYVNTQAPITAGGDLAFVAGNDITVQSSAGNPLRFVINRGTAVPNAITVKGNLKGQSVVLAMATRSGVNNALLSVDGSIEATGARITDRGVQLIAGDIGDTGGVWTVSGSETSGRAAIKQQGGTILSTWTSIHASDSINIAGDVTSSKNVSIVSSYGDANVGNVAAESTLAITGASVVANNLSSKHSTIKLESSSAGFIAVSGNVTTPGQLIIDSGTAYLGYDDDAETFSFGSATITARTGAIYGGKGLSMQGSSALAVRDVTLTAATDILFDPASSILISRAGASTSGLLKLTTGTSSNRIVLGNVTAQGITGLSGRLNHITFGDLDLIEGLQAGTQAGSIIGGAVKTGGFILMEANGSIQLNGTASSSSTVLRAGGNITLNGDVTSGSAVELTGNGVTARKLTAATNNIIVKSLGNDTVLGNLSAINGDISVVSGNGLTVGSLAAKNATLTGVAMTVVNGNVDIAGDYSVTGAEVRLGDSGRVVTQKAGGRVTLNSTYSRLVGDAGLKLWSLGTMTLNAKTDIAFAPDSTIQAGQGNAWRQLTLSTGAATDRISLGGVTADGIDGLTGRQNAITLGDVAVVRALNISTSVGDVTMGNLLVDSSATITNSAGDITLGNLRAVNGSLTVSGARNLTVGNAESANNLFLDARNTTANKVTSRFGDVEVRAWDGSGTLGTVVGRDILLRAAGNGNLYVGGISATRDSTIDATGILQIAGNVSVGGFVNWIGQSIAIGNGQPLQMQVGGNAGILATNGLLEITAGASLSSTGAMKLVSALGNLNLAGSITTGSLELQGGANIFLRGNITANTLELTRSQAVGADSPNVLQNAGILKVGRLSGSGLYSASLKGPNQITNIGNFNAEFISIANVGNLAIDGVVSAGDDTLIHTTGDLTITQNGRFQGSSQDVTLSANRLMNLAGSTVMASGVGWRIFLESPVGSEFGGLDSHDTAIWGKTIDSDLSKVAGNRYIFAWRPTLTFKSLDTGKTYGDDAAALLAGRYSVSGLHQGAAGAFLGDTLASAFSGAPLLSSLGSAANADVAGGPYVIDIGLGSLVSDAGYAFAFSNAGRLSIARKAITGTVTANSKTYDGTTAGTGEVGFTGALAGDDLSGSATFTFADKNAGAGKSVSVTNFTISGADADNYTVTLPASALADILRKAVNITVAIDDKTYDGTTSATGSTTASGIVAGDDFAISGGSYAFGDKNAGTGKTVSVSGITATGADAGNYQFTIPVSAVADILRKAVTVQITANGKTYDGTTATTGHITGIDGIISGDDLTASGGDYAFKDKNAGTGKEVGVSNILLSGADAGNYEVTVPRSAIADILKRAVTATATVDNKTYDGTTAGTGRIDLSNIVAGDDVGGSATYSFSDKNAGAGKTVTITGFGLSGADAGNYSVTVPTSMLADILRKAVNASAIVDTKTYDGTTAATGRVSADGVVAGDDVSFSNGSYAFADKNAGAGKTVNVSGITASGSDAGNYSFTMPVSALADILRKSVTVRIAADSKTYDGTTAATGRITGIDGIIGGDDLAASGGTYAFSDKNAGAGKQVRIGDVVLSGADAGNYEVTIPGSALADILRRSVNVTVTADSKTYDGTTAATGRVTSTTGLVDGDAVGLSQGSYTFADKNAGAGKTVSVTNLALTGADAGNYDLTLPGSVVADILRKAVNVTVTIDNKTYDGTTAATGHVSAEGVVSGDDITFTGGRYAFADKNAGAGKSVTVSGLAAQGADAGNYSFQLPTSALADILRKAVTVTIVADGKTYDGTTAATGRITGVDGVIAGDDLTASGGTYAFTDKNAGQNKTVIVSGIATGGADAGNYEIAIPSSVLATILRKSLNIAIAASGKTYDGTTAATGQVTDLSGRIVGDDVGVSGGTYSFADKNAGQGKSVSASGFTLTGEDAGNYQVGSVGPATADIARRVVTVRANNAVANIFDRDPALGYTLTEGSLASGDGFTGSLARAPGYGPGQYTIGQGSLALSSNYVLNFLPGTLTVEVDHLPTWLRAPSLYQTTELGGKARLLAVPSDLILWTPMSPCAPSDKEGCVASGGQ